MLTPVLISNDPDGKALLLIDKLYKINCANPTNLHSKESIITGNEEIP